MFLSPCSSLAIPVSPAGLASYTASQCSFAGQLQFDFDLARLCVAGGGHRRQRRSLTDAITDRTRFAQRRYDRRGAGVGHLCQRIRRQGLIFAQPAQQDVVERARIGHLRIAAGEIAQAIQG